MGYHFNVCFFPVQTDAFLTVYIWCCGLVTGIVLSSCVSVELMATRSLPHGKRLDNMEHLVTSQLLEAATCSCVFKLTYFLLHFFKPTVFSFIWLEQFFFCQTESHAYLEWDSTNSYPRNQLNQEKREKKHVHFQNMACIYICEERKITITIRFQI